MVDDVERQRVELEVRLRNVKMNLGMPDAKSLASRNQVIADLEAQLAALPPRPKPGPIGMEAGGVSVTIDGHRLGSGELVRPDTEPADDSRHAHEYDPFVRR